MNIDDYQDKSRETALYPSIQIIVNGSEPIDAPWLYPLLGLMGETGEVAEKFKKLVRDNQGIMTSTKYEEIKLELGDTDWYRARMADSMGLKSSEILQANLDKLFSRKERGTLGGSGDNR